MNIPEPLITQLLSDSSVLFLGAGASADAEDRNGNHPPIGSQLKQLLCDKFLGGKMKDRALSEVADYVENEHSLLDLQEFLRDTFAVFEPTETHELITQFPWHAIVTTNYDLVIERAYQSSKKKIREIEVFVKNGDKIDIKLKRGRDRIAYIKLHGCINSSSDTSVPLIITNEQYAKHKDNRDRLFSRLQDLGKQCSIIFCGYSMSDANLREIFYDLSNSGTERPRYYMVRPGIEEMERRYWERLRFTVIDATTVDFLRTLRQRTSDLGRATASIILPGSTSLNRFYKTNSPAESQELIEFLKSDISHVRVGMPLTSGEASKFYSGYDKDWWIFEQKLDVYRRVSDSIIVDAIMRPIERKNSTVELYVLKGPAGNGKSITLRRIAWDAAHDYEQLVLFLNESGSLHPRAIQEIHDLTGKRIFLFIDHIALVVDEVAQLVQFANKHEIALTIIAAERDNEWNVRCERLEEYIVGDFSVEYLTPPEINELIDLLEKHRCLGKLESLTKEQRLKEFVERAQRQLLVALHEVTLGRPFEEIVKDEYERIIPDTAKYLYLDICTLNRLNVPVRAGLIARVSGISFEKFSRELFSPLEHLVITERHPYINDHMYRARHPHVAELVFSQAFSSQEQRLEQILRLLRGINIDYTSDREAFFSIIKGRLIVEIFPDIALARKLFEEGHKIAKNNHVVYHQQAVFEMNHPGGSEQRALSAIERARDLADWDRTVLHTFANLKRRMAISAKTQLEREKLRADARRLIASPKDNGPQTAYELYTIAQLALDELLDVAEKLELPDVAARQASERKFSELVRNLESRIQFAKQNFPRNEQFLLLETKFLDLLKENARAERALAGAFETNPRNEYIAVRLSERYAAAKKYDLSLSVLRRCLEEVPSSKIIHYEISMIYRERGNAAQRALILDHLRKSFSHGDSNLMAQFWYARELFVLRRYDESIAFFSSLKDMPMSPQFRSEIRGYVLDEDSNIVHYTGSIVTLEHGYAFVRCNAFPKDIYCERRNTKDEIWSSLSKGSSVSFSLAFTMRGPTALDVHAAN